MTSPLADALTKFKAGAYDAVIRSHAAAAANPARCGQNLLVVLAQSYLKAGRQAESARLFFEAGRVEGSNHLNYLVIAGNLFLRLSEVGAAYEAVTLARQMAPEDQNVLELYCRTRLQTCLFAEIEAGNADLLARMQAGDRQGLAADNAFANISWCGDEKINASIIARASPARVTPEMQARRRAMPHRWGDRIRVGYLSDDFYEQHPVMQLIQGTLVSHDSEKFDITCFCFTSPENIARDRLGRTRYPNLVQLGNRTDAEAVDFIRSCELDILVDLKGHTQGCRPALINAGLAPIQVAWLGYPGSGNGIDCDYVISDRVVTPDSSIAHYHEKLCRLPDSYQANDNLFRPLPQPVSRAALGLPEDRIVFAFFNATRKISPQTFALTIEVLKACPDSLLWILFQSAFAERNFRAAAEAAGITRERIISAPKASNADHISRLAAADIGLDSFPYNGHTTTSDALWAGLPVITFKGSHFASRVSESLLRALDMPELVAADPQAYVELAVRLADDKTWRQEIRDRLAQNRHSAPLFDTARFTRHLEQAYTMMVDRARCGAEPILLDVPPQ